ncbi:MAG: diadenylate cyclase CdaA [Gemmatimonadales bacterium]
MPFEHFGFLFPGLSDVVQILIVAYVIYRLLMFLAGTRAFQILVGLISLVLIYFGAVLLKFDMITTLLGLVFTYGAFAAVVVFQPELRQALARLGTSRAIRFLTGTTQKAVADEIAEAVGRLSRSGTGAIIVLEGEVSLNPYLESGTEMQANVSADLLATIFTPYSPLHDGAVIIRGDQIVAAGCVLPLTQFPVTDRTLGTRHRAALGLSEETDAAVVVVSEETAKISIATRGLLRRGVSADLVRDALAGQDRPSLALTDAPGEASPA